MGEPLARGAPPLLGSRKHGPFELVFVESLSRAFKVFEPSRGGAARLFGPLSLRERVGFVVEILVSAAVRGPGQTGQGPQGWAPNLDAPSAVTRSVSVCMCVYGVFASSRPRGMWGCTYKGISVYAARG